MIDATGDLDAILDDCGGDAQTVNGAILGRFLEEPAEVSFDSGVILSSEPVFYASRETIAKVSLVRGAWIEVDGVRWYVKEIPRSETSGLVRIPLKK